jgi:predicted RNA binding protein YcfA (HicA-like mRNA interferase family)
MSRVTIRQVRKLLAELGFEERATKGSHVLYIYPKGSARVMVPGGHENDDLLPTAWLGIRRTIFEHGIMGPQELEDRVLHLSA